MWKFFRGSDATVFPSLKRLHIFHLDQLPSVDEHEQGENHDYSVIRSKYGLSFGKLRSVDRLESLEWRRWSLKRRSISVFETQEATCFPS